MTLREEVLKNSGLLTEEILEEGKFKKALLIAATIATLAGAIFHGPKIAKDVKQYKSVKDVPVATRFEKAEDETNKDIKGKEYLVGTMYDKMKFVEKIHADYNERNNRAVIYIDLADDAYGWSGLVASEIRNALKDYLKHLEEYSSNIEDRFGNVDFDRDPLKVVIRYVPDNKHTDNDFFGSIRHVVSTLTGVSNSNIVFEYKK